MVDVLHYFFEEDSRYQSGEEAESVSNLRSSVYRTMYGTTYKYPYTGGSSSSSGRRYISDSDPTNFNDFPSNEVKPYIPPTDFNPESSMPFGSALDSPLG